MATEDDEPLRSGPPSQGGSTPPTVLSSPGRGWLARHWAALLLGLIVGAVAAYVWGQQDLSARVELALADAKQTRQVLESELQAQRNRTENLQSQLLLEQGTRQGLETALKTAQAELGQAREKVAFFDQLLPSGPGGAVSVRGLDIVPQGAILSYRVLLTRQAPSSGTVFEGRLMFEAKGKQGGKEVELPLEFLADAKATEGSTERPVSFEWFLRQEGFLKLPPNFELTGLVLRVYEGKALRLSHTLDLPLAS
ncbi:hypothetical protein H0484_10095 [Pusillimonas sp. CC-YST705]|uniref:DUF3251 domain-containing protein n=1 Tax=Mesopusillimonas faecipullorum TaxID=2755040 RepID=A0ABS8CDI7_9BURK|nr:HlyD family secretion protein [Mesopusillimonas faecipullorum]MCB5364094.1 hypothetical protein [Mesopusillimonas faecipullorum]